MGKKYIIELEENEHLYKTEMVLGEPMMYSVFPEPYTEPDTEKVRKEEYEKGLGDAWEVALKIFGSPSKGALTIDEMKAIFGSTESICNYTASEAIEKIRQYEQEKEQEEIKVGDEVISEDDIKAVVIDMDNYLLHVLDENGVVQGWPREDVAKTDCHFPEIAEVLRKMRGNN